MNTKYLFLIITIIFLAGCPSVRPVGLYEVEDNLKRDLKKMDYVSYSGLISEDDKVKQEAENYIREQQCFFERANPLLISCTTTMDLSLKGVVTSTGQVKIAAHPEGLLGLEGILGVSSQTEQTIPFPVTVISLGALPDEYLAASLGGLEKCKDIFNSFEEEDRNKILAEIYGNYGKIKQRVEYLQNTFDCSKHCKEKCD
ncbi:MAG: hypothetical protein ACYSWP_07705 [Planctomycetota bacterium]|jgi:hypothetical protein